MTKDDGALNKVDEAILEAFHHEQPEYIPLVADQLEMHLKYVETRCERLRDDDLIKQVTGEAVYFLTINGENYLAGEPISGV